jgi:hypothetical protein
MVLGGIMNLSFHSSDRTLGIVAEDITDAQKIVALQDSLKKAGIAFRLSNTGIHCKGTYSEPSITLEVTLVSEGNKIEFQAYQDDDETGRQSS